MRDIFYVSEKAVFKKKRKTPGVVPGVYSPNPTKNDNQPASSEPIRYRVASLQSPGILRLFAKENIKSVVVKNKKLLC